MRIENFQSGICATQKVFRNHLSLSSWKGVIDTDMWNFSILGIELYRIFYLFIIYGFFGWIWESSYVSLKERKPVNRGFLNGPIIPIYGAGAMLIFVLFYNSMMINLIEHDSVKNYLIIFLVGMLAASVLEFVTSYAMEKLFHAKWWDYSDIPLNVQGRICLPVSLFWGALSIVLVKILHPMVSRWIAFIPRLLGEVAAYIILVLFLSDLVITVAATIHLDKKTNAVQKLREEVYEYIYGLKLYEAKESLKKVMADFHLEEMIHRGKQWYQGLSVHRAETEEVPQKGFIAPISEHIDEIEAKVKAVLEKYKATDSAWLQNVIYRRIFTAFPNLHMAGREEALRDIKEHLKSRKSKQQEEDIEERK